MSSRDGGLGMPFADTVLGKIFVGSVVAFVSFAIGAGGAWFVSENAPPLMNISPANLDEELLRVVRFNAGGSRDPEGADLSFAWELNGLPLSQSQAGQCVQLGSGEVLECRFSAPGTHSVSAIATDEKGKSSRVSSSVTITVPGGYVGLMINGLDQKTRLLIERILLRAVDWPRVQAETEKPIILNDPDGSGVVYAVSEVMDKEKARHMLRLEGFGDGGLNVDLIMARVPRDAIDFITQDMADLGVILNFIGVDYSMSVGLGGDQDGFIGPIDHPGEFAALLEERNVTTQ